MSEAVSGERDLTAELGPVIEGLAHNAQLGVEVIAISPGRCTAALPYRAKLAANPLTGVLHGGVVTTLIDTTAGGAVFSLVDGDTPVATLDMRIDYLKPAEPHLRLYAEAEVYRVTRFVAFVRAHAYQGHAGNRVAHCVAAFMTGSVGFAVAR